VNPDLHFASSWADCKKRRTAFLTALLSFFLLLALIAFRPSTGATGLLFFFLGLVSWAAVLATGVWYITFPCPRCERRFFWSFWESNLFALRCVHCGLRKWARDGEQTEADRRYVHARWHKRALLALYLMFGGALIGIVVSILAGRVPNIPWLSMLLFAASFFLLVGAVSRTSQETSPWEALRSSNRFRLGLAALTAWLVASQFFHR
jgi:hypothetical protein